MGLLWEWASFMESKYTYLRVKSFILICENLPHMLTKKESLSCFRLNAARREKLINGTILGIRGICQPTHQTNAKTVSWTTRRIPIRKIIMLSRLFRSDTSRYTNKSIGNKSLDARKGREEILGLMNFYIDTNKVQYDDDIKKPPLGETQPAKVDTKKDQRVSKTIWTSAGLNPAIEFFRECDVTCVIQITFCSFDLHQTPWDESKPIARTLLPFVKAAKANQQRHSSCLNWIQRHWGVEDRNRFSMLHYPRCSETFFREVTTAVKLALPSVQEKQSASCITSSSPGWPLNGRILWDKWSHDTIQDWNQMHIQSLGYLEDGPPRFRKPAEGEGDDKPNRRLMGLDPGAAIEDVDNEAAIVSSNSEVERIKKARTSWETERGELPLRRRPSVEKKKFNLVPRGVWYPAV